MAATFKERVASTKEVMAVLREAAILFCLALIIFFPAVTGNILHAANISTFSFGPFSLAENDETKSAAEKVSDTRSTIEALQQQMTGLQQQIAAARLPADAAFRSKVSDFATTLGQSDANLNALEETLKATLVKQQSVIADRTGSDPVADAGWIYLGNCRKGADGKWTWLDSQPTAIDAVPVAEIRPGTQLRLRGDAYIRRPRDDAALNKNPILGVLRAGTLVTVVEPISLNEMSADGSYTRAKVIVRPVND
ncbi:MAG TPA: hypothetical protein VM639_12320 [Dongiaceae bacterium]|nr:hypothetical protein [Dongiaceae bacterium]